MWSDEVQQIEARANIMRTVFGAIDSRAKSDASVCTHRSLRLLNLQNLADSDLIDSTEFRNVVADLRNLQIKVVEEYNEHGPDHDLELRERREFEPWLQMRLLPMVLDSLASLILDFEQCWGTAPGAFDGRNLRFANLKSLKIRNFIIPHNDHVGWILAQSNLRALQMVDVRLASLLCLEEESMAT